MNIPLVSVCVQTYQHVNFIKQCLDGILMQQTNFPFEIILGEDESTDGTREICKKYASKYSDKIKLFLRSRKDVIYINGNATGRYNLIENLEACKGKYIALCEGDDYWIDPLKLQKQVDFLEENSEFSLCFHNSEILNIRGNKDEKIIMHKNLPKDTFITKDLLCQWFIPTASIMYRNFDDFVLPPWFKNCGSGDIPLLLLLSLKGKFKYLDTLMSCYRLHDLGISIKHNGYDKVFSMIYIYQNFNIHSNFKFEEEINEAMIYEVRKHLPEVRELKKIKKQLNKNKSSLIKRIIKRIM